MMSRDAGRPPSVIEILASADVGTLTDLLDEDATFSSPAAEYRGRADVTHMLGLIASVLEGPREGSTATDGYTRLTTLTARHGGQPLEGVLLERHDERGRLVHLTLYLRPYRTLRACISAMRTLLDDAPLPSSRS